MAKLRKLSGLVLILPIFILFASVAIIIIDEPMLLIPKIIVPMTIGLTTAGLAIKGLMLLNE